MRVVCWRASPPAGTGQTQVPHKHGSEERLKVNPMTRSPDVFPAELAMMTAEENESQQPQRQPDHESKPGDECEPEHQSAAQNDRDEREPRHKGHAERTLAIGLLASKKDDAKRNQHEGEQRPNVGEVGRIANIHEPGGNSNRQTGDPSG